MDFLLRTDEAGNFAVQVGADARCAATDAQCHRGRLSRHYPVQPPVRASGRGKLAGVHHPTAPLT